MQDTPVSSLLLKTTGWDHALECISNLISSRANVLIVGPSPQSRLRGFKSFIESQNRDGLRVIVSEQSLDGVEFPSRLMQPTHEILRENLMRSALRQDPDAVSVDECGDERCLSLYLATIETGHIDCVTTLPAASAPEAVEILDKLYISKLKNLPNPLPLEELESNLPWILELGEIGNESASPIWKGLFRITSSSLQPAFSLLEIEGTLVYQAGPVKVDPRSRWEIRRAEEISKPYEVTLSPRKDIPAGKVKIVEELERRLASTARPAWVPQVAPFPVSSAESLSASESLRSQFGGGTWLRPGEDWPCCTVCNNPMLLVCQISGNDFADMPAERLTTGMPAPDELLQFFYCISLDCYRDSWEPFSPGQLARRISLVKEGAGLQWHDSPDIPDIQRLGTIRTGQVNQWISVIEYPSLTQLPDLDINLSDDEFYAINFAFSYDFELAQEKPEVWELFRQKLAPELDHFGLTSQEDLRRLSLQAAPLNGDKLGGWPFWTQGVEYPECPDCHQQMESVLQVVANTDARLPSEAHFPFLFAADGTGHLYHCPKHRERMTFTWACG